MSEPGWRGSLRVMIVYLSGVLFGSLGASVFEGYDYLQGASAGLYAIIWAHISALILNWKEDGLIYAKLQEDSGTVFENHLKCRIFEILAFSTNF